MTVYDIIMCIYIYIHTVYIYMIITSPPEKSPFLSYPIPATARHRSMHQMHPRFEACQRQAVNDTAGETFAWLKKRGKREDGHERGDWFMNSVEMIYTFMYIHAQSCTYVSINLSTYQPIYLSIYLAIYLSTYLSS